jgi:putative addiction module antidote
MTTLKLAALGNATCAVLPAEMLTRLNVSLGDTLYVTETANGYLITAQDPASEEALAAGRALMQRYPETFKALAE